VTASFAAVTAVCAWRDEFAMFADACAVDSIAVRSVPYCDARPSFVVGCVFSDADTAARAAFATFADAEVTFATLSARPIARPSPMSRPSAIITRDGECESTACLRGGDSLLGKLAGAAVHFRLLARHADSQTRREVDTDLAAGGGHRASQAR
jgi:hypothetical protein